MQAAATQPRFCACGRPLLGRPKHCSKLCGNRAYRATHRPERTCEQCGAILPLGRHLFCSDRCRDASPRYRQRRLAEDREGRTPQPWLRGPPSYVGRLPGGSCLIDLQPDPEWPIELRNTRALHGVLTVLLGKDHQRAAAWSLRPSSDSPCGWSVHFSDPEYLALAGRTHEVSIFNERRTLYLSDARPVPSPQVARHGHRTLSIDVITPVVIESMGRTIRRTAPEASHIVSTLRQVLAPRLGLSVPEADICIQLEHRETMPEHVQCGGKYGRVDGWTGYLLLDCNAVAEWLLRCAETLGLGSRTAFGFGAVAVREER